MDIVGEAYRQLSPHVRLTLLKTFVATLDAAPDKLDALPCGPAIRERIEACFETIGVLADEAASTLVKLALSDHGLDGEAFAAFESPYDRVADLWLRDDNHAKQVLRWFHANIQIRRRSNIEAFQTPRVASLELPGAEGQKRLQSLVQQVLSECLQAKDIRRFTISRRPSPWLGEEKRDLIQIDIKRSLDPAKFEIDEDGTLLVKSLRFIAAIVVVIDPARGAIYVLSKQNPRKLREELAMTVMQYFFEQGAEPFRIPKALVHPGKLARRQKFDLVRPEILSDVTVCELDYRNIAERGVRRSVVCEHDGVDLYDLTDLARTSDGREVFRAGLCFDLIGRDSKSHPKTAFLEHPNKLQFPFFSQREQAAAEEFLIRNGLLDPNPFQGQAGPLDLLAEVSPDIPANRIAAALGQKWTAALLDIGALISGALADIVHCDSCNRTHSLERDRLRPGEWIVACPVSPRPALPHDRRTFRFVPSRLAHWLATEYGTDSAQPSELHAGIWDLGLTATAGKQRRISLILVTSLADDTRLKAIAERVHLSPNRPRGLVLSLSSRHLGLRLPNAWKVAALSGLVDVEDGKLTAPRGGPGLILSGKQPRKAASRKQQWPDLFNAYREIRNHDLGPYEAADRLLASPGKSWPWGRDAIARRLKTEFPEDFANE